MSKRQRFFVELRQDEVTMVSWKKLLADGERMETSEIVEPSTISPARTVLGLNDATSPHDLNSTVSNPQMESIVSKSVRQLGGKWFLDVIPLGVDLCERLSAELTRGFSSCQRIDREKPRLRLKLARSNPTATKQVAAEQKRSLDDRTLITYSSLRPKSNKKRIMDEAKSEFGPEPHDSPVMQLATGPNSKGKAHRSMPGKTSCRAKKKTRGCFCCSNKDPGTQP